MSGGDLCFRWLRGEDDLSGPRAVRRRVFVEEQAVPEELEWDDHDSSAWHLVALEHGEAVATGRLVVVEGRHTMGRVAVLPSHRGRGIGAEVIALLVERALEEGAGEVHIHAQRQVEDLYRRAGFETHGEEFMEAGIRHVHMKLTR